MATNPRKPRAKQKPRQKKKPEESMLPLSISMNYIEDAPKYYINHIEISLSRHDFSLFMTQLPSKLSVTALQDAKDSGTINVEPDLNITVPPTLIPGLISALQRQQVEFEKLFGTIVTEGQKREQD